MRLGVPGLLAALWLLPSCAAAQRGFVYVAPGVGDGDAAALRRALRIELDAPAVSPDGVRRRLRRLARSARARPVEPRLERLERAALEDYLHFRFAASDRAWGRAIDLLLTREDRAVDATRLARLVFGRALVRAAMHRDDDAEADLAWALTLDPELSPSEDEYGPPVFRALERARRAARGRPRREVRVVPDPPSATVRVDGRLVEPGETLTLQAGARHLVTVTAPGYRARSALLDAEARGAVRIELPRASRGFLAAQAIRSREDDGQAPSERTGRLVALALSLPRLIVARPAEDGQLAVRSSDPRVGQLQAEARGARRPWELAPFAALAAAVNGRTLRPPVQSQVSLTISAPTRVVPGAPIAIRVRVRDPEARARRVEARCDSGSARAPVDGGDATVLAVSAPSEEGRVECRVQAVDAEERPLGLAAESVGVDVVASEGDDEAWIVGLGIGLGVAAAAAAAIAIGVIATEPREQVLRIHGP